MLDYYFKFVTDKQEIYSCDMVRLKFECNDYDCFISLIEKFSYTKYFKCNYYMNKKSFGYKDLWTFYIEKNNKKCSFTIGLGLNSSKLNKFLGFIEFNPNKCMQFVSFNYFYNDFLYTLKTIELVRYDLAIDLPIKRNEIKMIKNARCKYELYNDFEKERNYYFSFFYGISRNKKS